MRHKFGYKKLNRTSEHRKALIKNMLNSLIKYEQIKTTLPKAKVLKPEAEKIITLGKKESLKIKKYLSLNFKIKNQHQKSSKLYLKDMKKEMVDTPELLKLDLDMVIKLLLL